MTIPRLLWLAPLLLVAAGCRAPDRPAPAADPQISGERIAFPSGAPQLSSIGTAPVAPDSTSEVTLYGHLVWDEDATARVFTPFAGRVRRVLVDAGQRVARGAPLAEVESPDFGEAQADARTAESDLRLAESNLARLRELYEHGAAARKEVDAAEADRARALAQRARAAARLASCGARADSVTGLFLLRAPIAGTVVERNLTPGQEIRADQMLANAPQLFSPLFVISDPGRLWIQIDATETELPLLRPGTPFRFTSTAYPGRAFDGRVDVVAESMDPGTHSIRARGTVANPQRLLKAEMYVSVTLAGEASSAARVPSRAVFLQGDRHYVFVEERPGTFARREVRVRSERDSDVTVSAGVRAGDRVVTDGAVLLEELLD